MLIRSLLSLTLLVGLFALTTSACGGQGPIVMTPSLGPVDTTRPMVRYQPIQGTSCESLLDAIWDMKRLVGVDGYVEVTVQKEKCWTATAYPFTYGNRRKELSVRRRAPRGSDVSALSSANSVRASAPAPRANRVAPAPAPAPARQRYEAPSPPPVAAPAPPPAPRVTLNAATCEPACRSFGKYAGTTALIQRVVGDRCISRCTGGDMAYYECVSRTRNVNDVKRCNAN